MYTAGNTVYSYSILRADARTIRAAIIVQTLIVQTLKDITASFHLYAVCVTCVRMEQLPVERLSQSLGPDTPLQAVRQRLRCRCCGVRSADMRIVYVGPGRAAAGFHYRR